MTVATVGTQVVSVSDPAAEPLEPNRDSWVKPQYGKVLPDPTGATGGEEEDMPAFKPSMVPRGHFSGKPEPGEPVKPTMVEPGALQEERRREMEAEHARLAAIEEEHRAKVESELQKEKDFVCSTVDVARQLARGLYTSDKDTAKGMITNLLESVCPALKIKAPHATKDLSCDDLVTRVQGYFDKKYEGKVPQTQTAYCGGEEPEIRNYAIAQALHSARNFFQIGFCPEEMVASECGAPTGAAEETEAEEETETEDDLLAAADETAQQSDAVISETQTQV